MKRLLIMIIFLMCPLLSFADNAPDIVQAHVCGAGKPASQFYTPDELRAGINNVGDHLCLDASTHCPETQTCCGGTAGVPGSSHCCIFVDAVCCGNGTTCCPNGYTCSATGASCIKH